MITKRNKIASLVELYFYTILHSCPYAETFTVVQGIVNLLKLNCAIDQPTRQ